MLLVKKPGCLLGYGNNQNWFLRLQSPHRSVFPLLMALSSSPQSHHLHLHSSASSSAETEVVRTYHEETKHSFRRYARGPHGLDWANQPNPFRRYNGSPVIPLDHIPPDNSHSDPPYPQPFSGFPEPKPLCKATLSQLLYDSLALSAWKTTGYSTWSLRVNPSSGNLHPTEGYIISGPIHGVSDSPFVAHYAPKEHALEIRAALPGKIWTLLSDGFPSGTFFIGFASIFWREAWKYGERAFRYCNHDVGHAIGAASIAAASIGWDAILLDDWSTLELQHLLGLHPQVEISTLGSKKGYFPEVEQEHPDCLLAIFPGRAGKFEASSPSEPLKSSTISSLLDGVSWRGMPNSLSKEHIRWGIIYKAAAASHKPPLEVPRNIVIQAFPKSIPPFNEFYQPVSIREVVRKRRSAVDMDGITTIPRNAFYQILMKVAASGLDFTSQGIQTQLPFRALPWKAELHLALFVHRVDGLEPGLYFLVRNSEHEKDLRKLMRPDFKWQIPEGCPDGLPLYRLASGDCGTLAMRLSCHQEIARDGCFSMGMIARFEPALHERGAWMYPRLFWESGVLGQLLYLEAHALGISATGIGCYFDDAVHEVLGFSGKEFQSLYHFTIGGPVQDKRIMSLPAYPGPAVNA